MIRDWHPGLSIRRACGRVGLSRNAVNGARGHDRQGQAAGGGVDQACCQAPAAGSDLFGLFTILQNRGNHLWRRLARDQRLEPRPDHLGVVSE